MNHQTQFEESETLISTLHALLPLLLLFENERGGQKVTKQTFRSLVLTPAFVLFSSPRRCDSAGGRVGALLGRTSLPQFAARKGWTEVPCTRLDKGTNFLLSSLRTRSVPIIPSLQASDHADGNDPDQEVLKRHPVSAGRSTASTGGSPSPPGVPPSVIPPATTPSALGFEKNPNSAKVPFEISVEIAQELKHKSLSSPVTISGSHRELEAVTVQESEGKGIYYSPRVLHTGGGSRGFKAAFQREAPGHCRGQAPLVYGGANCSSAAEGSDRGAGNARAKPSAS